MSKNKLNLIGGTVGALIVTTAAGWWLSRFFNIDLDDLQVDLDDYWA